MMTKTARCFDKRRVGLAASRGVVIVNLQQLYQVITYSETLRAHARVTVQCEYEVICDLSSGVFPTNLK